MVLIGTCGIVRKVNSLSFICKVYNCCGIMLEFQTIKIVKVSQWQGAAPHTCALVTQCSVPLKTPSKNPALSASYIVSLCSNV